MERPLAVAVTGGIAAGKSEALAAFARHGALVSSSDELVHRLYREDVGLKEELRARWGDDVFADGEVDRAAVGRIVFSDRAELAWLLREARRGAVDDRESRLIPDEEKLRRADFAFVNDGTLEELDAFVAGVVEELASC